MDTAYNQGWNCTKCDREVCCDPTIIDSEFISEYGQHLLTISVCTVPGPDIDMMSCDIALTCSAGEKSESLSSDSQAELIETGQTFTVQQLDGMSVGLFFKGLKFPLDDAGYGKTTISVSNEMEVPFQYAGAVSFSINPPGSCG